MQHSWSFLYIPGGSCTAGKWRNSPFFDREARTQCVTLRGKLSSTHHAGRGAEISTDIVLYLSNETTQSNLTRSTRMMGIALILCRGVSRVRPTLHTPKQYSHSGSFLGRAAFTRAYLRSCARRERWRILPHVCTSLISRPVASIWHQ